MPNRPGSFTKALLVGLSLDLLGAVTAVLVTGVIHAAVLARRGYSEDQIERALWNLDPLSAVFISGALVGLVIATLAGYRTALAAKRGSYVAPGIVAVVSCAIGALASRGSHQQLWLAILSALNVTAVLCGAWVYVRKIA